MAAKLKHGQELLEQRIEEATRLLTAQKEEAERANLAKSRFLAAATHDLRQPMHALTLFVAALKERIQYPEVSRIVHNIESSVTAMQGMFNALLDISRLDAGVLQAHPRDFHLQALFDRLLLDFSPHAMEKQIRLSIVPTRGHCAYRSGAVGTHSDEPYFEWHSLYRGGRRGGRMPSYQRWIAHRSLG